MYLLKSDAWPLYTLLALGNQLMSNTFASKYSCVRDDGHGTALAARVGPVRHDAEADGDDDEVDGKSSM